MLYCCVWPGWWGFLTLLFPLLFQAELPERHSTQVAMLKKQCFLKALAVLLFTSKSKTKTHHPLLWFFQAPWEEARFTHTGCACIAALRLKALSRGLGDAGGDALGCGQQQSPMGWEAVTLRAAPWPYTRAVWWRPAHLHMGVDPSACVAQQD